VAVTWIVAVIVIVRFGRATLAALSSRASNREVATIPL
jgi:hypothetical protein